MEYFVLMYGDTQEYVGVDQGSGGYIYPVNSIQNANEFTESEAIRYQRMFSNDNLKIRKVTLTISVVD